MAYTRQKYFEENEYYVREYQVDKSGLSREQVQKERRTYGQPFEISLTGFSSNRPSPIDRSILGSDVSRKYEYAGMNRINKSSSEIVREKGFQHSQNCGAAPVSTGFQQHCTQPYIHPIKYCGLPIVQQPSPRQSHVVLQPVGQAAPDVRQQDPQHHHQAFSPQNNMEKPATGIYSPNRAGSPQTLTGAGDIENTDAGFTIHLNVEHFDPTDIKVTLSGNILSVLGERIDTNKAHEQTLKRSFSRKYCIPEDIKTGSIKSFVSESGTLIIKGSRKTWKETEIDIQIEPPQSKNAVGSVASPKSTQISPAASSKSKASVKSFSKSASVQHSDEE